MGDVGTAPLCVCVPARNEADRLPVLLKAIAAQDYPGVIPVAIAVNNTTDTSLDVLERCRADYWGRLSIDVTDIQFAPREAHAGSARGLAMDRGAELLGDHADAILVSTDADARPPATWLSAIAAGMARGADLVGGRIVIDPLESLPVRAAVLHDALDRYWERVRAIEDAIDPVAWDLPPRHGDHTGASLAITLRAYRACGGVPRIASGEDRALVMAAVAQGARLAHPSDVWVNVSPRCDGRAEGGMAEDMARLVTAGAGSAPLLMPDFDHWRARAEWRRSMRAQAASPAHMVRAEALLPPMPHDMPLEVMA
ncbi:glycosyltransferase [Blastomonas sp.]|uniref:glycosyltransferase n=1 Tax=Blastomonas sp. TaxID=1909299 RepID=UPI002628ED86|nr:glycosyltransferase [Blastomonas sp.]MDM7955729.1 glycosyltransferase [Blastomonas sp.]